MLFQPADGCVLTAGVVDGDLDRHWFWLAGAGSVAFAIAGSTSGRLLSVAALSAGAAVMNATLAMPDLAGGTVVGVAAERLLGAVLSVDCGCRAAGVLGTDLVALDLITTRDAGRGASLPRAGAVPKSPQSYLSSRT